MALNSRDVWGHFAPMFHLVDAFAIYAITLVGGRHAILPTFTLRRPSSQLVSNLCDTAVVWPCCFLPFLYAPSANPMSLVLHIREHFPLTVHADPA